MVGNLKNLTKVSKRDITVGKRAEIEYHNLNA